MTPKKASCAIVVLPASAALFAPAADAATEFVLYSFQNNGKDGLLPQANLLELNGALYGTTEFGVTYGCQDGCGTIYSVHLATGAESVLHSFRGEEHQGPAPGSLVGARDMLFGTAYAGGKGAGLLFSIGRKSGHFRRRYSFCDLYDCSDGESPNSGLLDLNGALYGTTESGGAVGPGTIFSFDPNTGTETVLYSFCSQENCADGSFAGAGLLSMNGTLYGTTIDGGIGSYCNEYNFCGTVFSFDPVSGVKSVIHSFCSQQNCADGEEPRSNLVVFKHALYGTTYGGGAYGFGAVFSIDLSTGAETVLHSFGSKHDGTNPFGGLVDVNGRLYGVTSYGEGRGASCDCGVAYSIDPNTGREKVVYSFCSQAGCADGANPEAGLLNVNGTLYGVTYEGGSGTCNDSGVLGCGTVFAITP